VSGLFEPDERLGRRQERFEIGDAQAQPDLWAILENKPGVELLPALAAWRVDRKSKMQTVPQL
jgi:hypothetical protein